VRKGAPIRGTLSSQCRTSTSDVVVLVEAVLLFPLQPLRLLVTHALAGLAKHLPKAKLDPLAAREQTLPVARG